MNNVIPDISNQRCVNAPIALVWELWSNPEHLAQWWGPRGFRNTIRLHEFKPGGRWHLVMHGPDGVDYDNEWEYTEIVLHSRIVLNHWSHPKFYATIQFKAEEDRTWVYFDMTFENATVAESVKDFAIIGNEQNLERLEAALAAITGKILAKPFVLSRPFQTSVERMWDMWTKPEHMSQWWGPKEAAVGYCNMDLRRGGTYHYALETPDGNKIWGKMYFKDIVLHKRLLFVGTFSDEQGGITTHPMSADWPKELLTTISFEAQDAQTVVTIEWLPINASEKEIACFNQAHDSMTGGWTGSLDRLEGVLVAQ